ncbi:MAG: NYN domain-containing protein [Euryarchaeota archaeon]|nr:NYN domain-containing protein [Euryarchaeota archaeon]
MRIPHHLWWGALIKAIIIAGDGDHVPAVKAAKEEGIIVEVYYLPRNAKGDHTISRELYDLCDERVPLTKEILSEFVR